MRRYAHTTSLLLLLFFLFHLVVSEIPSNQRNTMINLYNLLQNNTGQPPFPWDFTRDPCSWKGVTCNVHNSSITQFSLQFFSLSNPDFLPVLCQIDTLESIDLSNNRLNSIPSGFMTGCGNLSGLRELDFSTNRLSGSLPNLQNVDLYDNSLEGSVPENISSSLVRLRLGNNRLNGTIPSSSFGSLQKLINFEVDNNSLEGSIPPELGLCKNLRLLNLAKNQLTSVLPIELGNLTRLQELKLEANKLVGEIPIAIVEEIEYQLEFAQQFDSFFDFKAPES
ncbi:hypothetical protein C3L33_19176, partial [Rhododendron williamsianum]